MIRAPICTVVGHVDHGKTTLLDTVRGTAVTAGEAGKITQAIGASIIPIDHILKQSASFIKQQKVNLPGLLFIDTPGHAAFTGMRERGGSLADIAVLIVDLNEGFKPQTKEAIEILKAHKTPFVVAANKLDLAPGYRQKHKNIIQDIQAQGPRTNEYIETKTYEIVGSLAEHGLNADRFDRVDDFQKKIAIIPISALKQQGLDSLLAVLVGLAQRFLEDNLHADTTGLAKGTILEVSEEKGMGATLNAIIYDGTLRVGDEITIATMSGEPLTTKVRALLQPNTVGDIRDRKTKFVHVQEAVAATGIKISAPDLQEAAAGMPFAAGNPEQVKEHLQEHVQGVAIDTDAQGVILKADNIGSLEALVQLLREKNISIRSANIGPVSKKDLAAAASNPAEHAAVLAFNLPACKEPIPEGVQLFEQDIIYALIDDYQQHLKELEEREREEAINKLPIPARIEVLTNCMFRASNPLVCGVHISHGELKVGARLVSEKEPENTLGYVKEIQEDNDTIPKAPRGSKVAISVPGCVAERHISEEDVLWAAISEEEYLELKKNAKHLTGDQKAIIKSFAQLMRDRNPLWGI